MSVNEIGSLANTDLDPPQLDGGETHQSATDTSLPDVKVFNEADLGEKKMLGKGGFGIVYKRIWKNNSRSLMYVAEKEMLSDGRIDREAERGLKNEARNLKKIQHPNIIELLGILPGEQRFSLITEYIRYGCCTSFLKLLDENKMEHPLRWPLKFRISLQVCEAMTYLHDEAQLLHLDLKSNNVLIDDALDVKVCDFGLSQFYHLNSLSKSSAAALSKQQGPATGGTITHIAPERLHDVNHKPNTKSDVYSYAIFLWELLSEEEPYRHAPTNLLLESIRSGQRPDLKRIPKDAPVLLRRVMKNSWDNDPDERPEFKEIRKELLQYPRIFSDREIKQSIATIKSRIDSRTSDSQLLFTPLKRPPYSKIIRSEGESRPVRLPFGANGDEKRPFVTAESDTTRIKRPVGPSLSLDPTTTTSHLPSNNFPTQTVPLTNPPHHSDPPLTPLSSEDLRISADEPNEDTRPLLEAQPLVRKPRKRIICGVIIIIALCACAAAVVVPLCITHGCFVTCSHFSSDIHGSNNCSTISPHPGTTCSVSCASGYGIKSGSSTLTCLKNGTWSNPMPSCSKLRSCPDLVKPANGGGYTCTDDFYEMSVCDFTCPAGSCLRLPGSSICTPSLQDGANGISTKCNIASSSSVEPNWTSPVPYCEKAIPCSTPPDPPVGQYQCKFIEGKLPTNGTVCKLSCDPPFGVPGPSSILCQNNGEWNATAQQCVRECPTLEPNPDRSFNCTHQFLVNSVCTFGCKENFVMLGPIRVTCSPDGTWKNPAPTCVCPACFGGDKCDQSAKWVDALKNMKESLPDRSFTYVGRSIKCYQRIFNKRLHDRSTALSSGRSFMDSHSRDVASNFSCVCRDVVSNLMKQCNNYSSLDNACTTTLSTFMRYMAYKKLYQLPCDANLMSPPCDTN